MFKDFKEIDIRTPDPFAERLSIDLKRFSICKDKYTLTVVCYGKAIFKGVIQDIIEEVSETDAHIRIVRTDKAWESPFYTTLQEVVRVCIDFANEL